MRRQTLNYLVVVAITVLAALTSCHDDNKNATPELTLIGSQNIEFAANPDEAQIVTIQSNIKWSITIRQTGEWLNITPLSGSDNEDITLTAQKNIENAEREAIVTISDMGGSVEAKIITVTQNAESKGDNSFDETVATLITSIPEFEEADEKPLITEVVSSDEHNEIVEIENQVYNTLWRCTKEKYSASENPNQFMLFDPLASVLWPGNLVQGNSIASGVPNSIPISVEKRKLGSISMAIVSNDVSGATNKYYREVEMSLSKVNQAMNEILSGYNGGTAAKYNFSMDNIYSESQFAASLGAGFSVKLATSSTSATSSFGIDWSKKLTRVSVKLYQQYFTMTYDDPHGIQGVFNSNITLNDVVNYTGNGNPMCYISSVTYGRIYILLYESTASERELNAALNFAYSGKYSSGYVENETHYKDIMEKTSVRLMQIGGDPESGLNTATAADVGKIQDFLTKGANFSSKSVGAPLSYTVKYLKDAKLVRMNNTLEYEVEQCVAVSSEVEFVENEFTVYFDKAKAYIRANVINIFRVYSNIEIGIYDKISGTHTTLWESPTDDDSPYKYVGWFQHPGGTLPEDMNTHSLEWNVPIFKVKSDPNLSIYFSFNSYITNDKNFGDWTNSNKMYLDYDVELHRWTPRSNDTNQYTQFVQGNYPSDWIRYYYVIMQNNKKLE